MIMSHQIRDVAYKYLHDTLQTVPGARTEVLTPSRFNVFISLLTQKCNELDVYAYTKGHARWNWPDFVQKLSAKYAHDILTKIEHSSVQTK